MSRNKRKSPSTVRRRNQLIKRHKDRKKYRRDDKNHKHEAQLILEDLADSNWMTYEDMEDTQKNRLAEFIIDNLVKGVYRIGWLNIEQKLLLFRYLYKFNDLIHRIVDLHVKIPLSTIRLQKPSTVNSPVVKDYVYYKFEKLFEIPQFKQALYDMVRDYWVYGIGAVTIQDDYEFDKDTVIDEIDELSRLVVNKKGDTDTDNVDEIEESYVNNPGDVDIEDREKVIGHYFKIINKSVKIKKIKKISPFVTFNRSYNPDIDYAQYEFLKSKELQVAIDNSKYDSDGVQRSDEQTIDLLKRAGYSEAMIRVHKEGVFSGNTYTVDNDPFNDQGMYVCTLERQDGHDVDSSILNSVLEQAINILIAKRVGYEKVGISIKKTNIVKMPQDTPDDKVAKMEDELKNAAEAEQGYFIVTTADVDVVGADFNIKDSVDQSDVIDDLFKDITTGLGMPESLVGGEDSYGSQFLKVEILTNEYVAFRSIIKELVEEKIFKPMAIKWGFVAKNEWGDVIPVYPTIKFDKLSLARSSEDFNLIKEMVTDGILPIKTLLDMLGFDIDDIEGELIREKTSILNSEVSRMIGDALSDLSDKLISNDAFLERVGEAIGIDLQKKAKPEDDSLEDRLNYK